MKRVYALIPDPQDDRDRLFTYRATQLPEVVDLRPFDAESIFDQLWLGSCTANAICGLLSFLDKKRHGYFFHYSRLYLYWHERVLLGTVNEDSGAILRDGFKVAQQRGCAGESTFPYIPETYKNAPSKMAEDAAAFHKIEEYHRIGSNSPQGLKECLASGYPAVMGVEIWSSFESAEVARTGIVPMPDKTKEYSLGGHAMLCMGYKKINGKDYVITKNSWGTEWGDNGYCYIPFDFFGRYITDLWTGR